MQTAHDLTTTPRLLARLLRDVLRAETFDRYADLVDVLKTRASRLRIRYRGEDVTTAIRWVESNTPVVTAPALPRAVTPDRLVKADPPVSREIAARILADLRRMNPTHTEAECLGPKTQ